MEKEFVHLCANKICLHHFITLAIDNGVDINYDNDAALLSALKSGNDETVGLLLETGRFTDYTKYLDEILNINGFIDYKNIEPFNRKIRFILDNADNIDLSAIKSIGNIFYYADNKDIIRRLFDFDLSLVDVGKCLSGLLSNRKLNMDDISEIFYLFSLDDIKHDLLVECVYNLGTNGCFHNANKVSDIAEKLLEKLDSEYYPYLLTMLSHNPLPFDNQDIVINLVIHNIDSVSDDFMTSIFNHDVNIFKRLVDKFGIDSSLAKLLLDVKRVPFLSDYIN